MKHLFVSCPPRSQPGGASHSAWRVVEGLRLEGWRVTTFAVDPLDFVGDERTEGDDHVVGAPPDLQVHTRWIRAHMQRTRPDLVLGWYGTGPAVPAVMAARELGIPVAVSLRGNDVDRDAFRPRELPHLRLVLERANARFTVSSHQSHRLRCWFDVDSTVLPNGVDTTSYRPVDPEPFKTAWSPDGRPVLGMFGAFKPKRGLEWLAHLDPARFQVVLVGEVRSDVTRMIPETVVHHPWTSDVDTLCALYSAMDVMLQPSHDDGMPNVMLEAMACGTPVVGTRVGGMPDVLTGDNGVVFDDPPGLLTAIDTVLARPEMREHARASVRTLLQERQAWNEALSALL